MKLCLKVSACVAVGVAYALLLTLHPFSAVCFLLGLPVCFLLSGLLHELGHLLAYLVLGLEWKRLQFSFLVFRAGEGLSIDPNCRFFSASCTCAYHAHVPTRRYTIALLAGGVTTLLAGAVTALLSLTAAGGGAAFLQHFGLAGILSGIYNLLPISPDRVLLQQIKQEREQFDGQTASPT